MATSTEPATGSKAARAPRRLSKSRFLYGWQCELRLWNAVHRPQLATPFNQAQLAMFDAGHDVGDLARQRYPGGLLVEIDHRNIAVAVEHTEKEGESIED